MPASEQSLTPIQLQRLSEQSTRYTRPAFLLQLLLLVLLVLCPLLFQSFRVMDVVAKIMIFAVAVASFDIIIKLYSITMIKDCFCVKIALAVGSGNNTILECYAITGDIRREPRCIVYHECLG